MSVIEKKDTYVCDYCGKNEMVPHKSLPESWFTISLTCSIISHSNTVKPDAPKIMHYCSQRCFQIAKGSLETYTEEARKRIDKIALKTR